jgi:hypothetical protein
MARVVHRFTYGAGDPVTPTHCLRCRQGGRWVVKIGAPELQGGTIEHWNPKTDDGICFPNTDVAKHVIVLNPELWSQPIRINEVFFHELFHAIDHAELSRKTEEWWLPHSVIKRMGRALAKWMAENNLELVKRKAVVHEESRFLPDDE